MSGGYADHLRLTLTAWKHKSGSMVLCGIARRLTSGFARILITLDSARPGIRTCIPL